jgi:hypothetical protein
MFLLNGSKMDQTVCSPGAHGQVEAVVMVSNTQTSLDAKCEVCDTDSGSMLLELGDRSSSDLGLGR